MRTVRAGGATASNRPVRGRRCFAANTVSTAAGSATVPVGPRRSLPSRPTFRPSESACSTARLRRTTMLPWGPGAAPSSRTFLRSGRVTSSEPLSRRAELGRPRAAATTEDAAVARRGVPRRARRRRSRARSFRDQPPSPALFRRCRSAAGRQPSHRRPGWTHSGHPVASVTIARFSSSCGREQQTTFQDPRPVQMSHPLRKISCRPNAEPHT